MTAKKSDEIPKERDPDLKNAEEALKRAVRKVRERAGREGAAVVFVKDGKIVEEVPDKQYVTR